MTTSADPTPSGRTCARLLHATVVPADLPTSLAFYDAVFGALGMGRHSEFPDEEERDSSADAVGFGSTDSTDTDALFWLVAGDSPTAGAHIALAAVDRAQVDAFWRAATTAGGTTWQAPRGWEIYRRDYYYGAIVADPDGNLVEAVASG
jgi:catechol 2,3-dioxygenase-like lactoylglutathione lyase family enzyme